MERKRVFDAHVPGILTYRWKNIMILSQEAEQSGLQPEYQGVSGVFEGGRGEEKRVAESPQKSPLP